jgi:hypothetical protein
MDIMNEVSYLNPHVGEVNVLTLDDPELFRYPVAYVIEVDWWAMTDSEAAALRTYLQKGGFPDRGRLQAAPLPRWIRQRLRQRLAESSRRR